MRPTRACSSHKGLSEALGHILLTGTVGKAGTSDHASLMDLPNPRWPQQHTSQGPWTVSRKAWRNVRAQQRVTHFFLTRGSILLWGAFDSGTFSSLAACAARPHSLSAKARAKCSTGTNLYARVSSAQYCCTSEQSLIHSQQVLAPS